MLFFLLILIIPYFVAGSRIGRNNYALRMHDYTVNHLPTVQENSNTYISLKSERDGLTHDSYCYSQTPILANQGCKNCRSQKRTRELNASMKTARAIVMSHPVPRSPYFTIIGWPLVLFDGYMKGGTVKKPDYNLIAELEKTELR